MEYKITKGQVNVTPSRHDKTLSDNEDKSSVVIKPNGRGAEYMRWSQRIRSAEKYLKNIGTLFRDYQHDEHDKENTVKYSLGFMPSFYDTSNGTAYISRYANGSPAPVHIIDGLPKNLKTARTKCISENNSAIITGFVQGKHFYTREQTAKVIKEFNKLMKSASSVAISNCE